MVNAPFSLSDGEGDEALASLETMMEGLTPPLSFDQSHHEQESSSEQHPPEKKAMCSPEQQQEFAQFMSRVDPSLKLDTAKVASMFSFQDVCDGLQKKYNALPPGWTASPPSSAPTKQKISDYKINEILDTERRFVQTILELQNSYLDRLYEIFGSGQKDVIKHLGLTQDETNQIFEQLPQICRFSQTLLQKLEVINLCRVPPVTGEGRAIYVGRAFLEMAPKLHVYAPAITSYQQSLDILTSKTASKALTQKQGNFLQLWEKVTADNAVLRGQQLNAVLITPMQRIPRYKMLLEQLVKDCDHPDSVSVVQEALDMFSSAAKNINEALRSHQKLKGFFGAGTELKPMSSSGGTTKDGEVKVVNTYTNKLIGT